MKPIEVKNVATEENILDRYHNIYDWHIASMMYRIQADIIFKGYSS